MNARDISLDAVVSVAELVQYVRALEAKIAQHESRAAVLERANVELQRQLEESRQEPAPAPQGP